MYQYVYSSVLPGFNKKIRTRVKYFVQICLQCRFSVSPKCRVNLQIKETECLKFILYDILEGTGTQGVAIYYNYNIYAHTVVTPNTLDVTQGTVLSNSAIQRSYFELCAFTWWLSKN